jgi:hypothetical protein
VDLLIAELVGLGDQGNILRIRRRRHPSPRPHPWSLPYPIDLPADQHQPFRYFRTTRTSPASVEMLQRLCTGATFDIVLLRVAADANEAMSPRP